MSKKLWLIALTLSLVIATLTGCNTFGAKREVVVDSLTSYEPKQELELIQKIRKTRDSNIKLSELYQDITLIDIHNHAAENPNAVNEWTQDGIDRVVLFGDVSEPSAQRTDQLAWEHYRNDPSHVYPSFAGFPIYEEEGLTIVKDNLEQGYLNIGEVVAASSYSPVVSKVEWKSEHPNDGYLPQIYDLAAKYRVPVLLHIDPPSGSPIDYLEQALDQHPDTSIIFGHANAYNTPDNIKYLLDKHSNLYIDFFAGFTAYSPDSSNSLQDFVPIIEQYPDRFMLSTDSGFGLPANQARDGLYDLIDLLSDETALKVASLNYERMIELQLPTDTQIAKIKKLATKKEEFKTYHLNKRMANELIFELEK
ncbi:amidohydrolase family protein [Paenibacillus segetis]|uniref:Amidohydrolase-related domain-containing protein n=1 Tax=Paenibacillus segetis TaxID=1325360 RepID=A0ABQ1YNK7_9BACL|nr:amidohydrolase family protein [Paenibacillus segetis]GGH30747.1 hypothetical protein GCM10008013_34030 [Paenibacillus segetis]